MRQDPTTKEFLRQLKDLAARLDHKYLADQLGVKVGTLRNWLYRTTPNEIVVRALRSHVERKWRRLCSK